MLSVTSQAGGVPFFRTKNWDMGSVHNFASANPIGCSLAHIVLYMLCLPLPILLLVLAYSIFC